ADSLEGSQSKDAANRKYPVNSYLNTLEGTTRELELIRLSTKQELARQEELFFMLLKDLRKNKHSDIIIEGNLLIPDLVKSRFELPYRAVYLLPTYKFQSEQYLKRDWAVKLIQQSDDPSLMLHNWIRRDSA